MYVHPSLVSPLRRDQNSTGTTSSNSNAGGLVGASTGQKAVAGLFIGMALGIFVVFLYFVLPPLWSIMRWKKREERHRKHGQPSKTERESTTKESLYLTDSLLYDGLTSFDPFSQGAQHAGTVPVNLPAAPRACHAIDSTTYAYVAPSLSRSSSSSSASSPFFLARAGDRPMSHARYPPPAPARRESRDPRPAPPTYAPQQPPPVDNPPPSLEDTSESPCPPTRTGLQVPAQPLSSRFSSDTEVGERTMKAAAGSRLKPFLLLRSISNDGFTSGNGALRTQVALPGYPPSAASPYMTRDGGFLTRVSNFFRSESRLS